MKRIDWTEERLAQLPMSAELALSKGSKHYFSGQPCKRGHIAALETKKKQCVECRREQIRASAERRRRRVGMKQQQLTAALPKGFRSNRLTATGNFERRLMSHNKKIRTSPFYEVICDCGRVFWMRAERWNTQVQCFQCDRREKLHLAHAAATKNAFIPNGNLNPVEAALLRSAHQRASKSGLDIDLTVDDIIIPKNCPVLGIPIAMEYRQSHSHSPRPNAPSLDKIDPKQGYVRGNVAIISYRANVIKKDGTAEEHLKVAEFMERMGVKD